MSKAQDNETQQHSAELRNGAAHIAEMHSLDRIERTQPVQQRSVYAHNDGHSDHGIATFGRDQIAELAHQLWIARGRPEGSPDADWYQAAQDLRAKAATAR